MSDEVTSPEAADVAGALFRPAEEYVNDAAVEGLWAVRAYHYAETHHKLLASITPTSLRLSKIDDRLLEHFRSAFPDFSLQPVVEEQLKSADAKVAWREFCNTYQGEVADFDTGTLLRLRCDLPYDSSNTILVARIQFYAIEAARNRSGLNDIVRLKYGSEASSTESASVQS